LTSDNFRGILLSTTRAQPKIAISSPMVKPRVLAPPNSSNRSDSCGYKSLIPQVPSIDNLTNAPGVVHPKSEHQANAKTLSPLESALAKKGGGGRLEEVGLSEGWKRDFAFGMRF
jgi:hypothetical protein